MINYTFYSINMIIYIIFFIYKITFKHIKNILCLINRNAVGEWDDWKVNFGNPIHVMAQK